MSSLELTRDQYLEVEKIGLGAFAPLEGFMTELEFKSVIETMRLPSGAPFSLPVILDIDLSSFERIKDSLIVNLFFKGILIGNLTPFDFYSCDRSEVAKKIFGTDDALHPGVENFYKLNQIFVGGKIHLIHRAKLDISCDELTPEQTKEIFKIRGWSRIVGFQTRNVPHRAHEYLLRIALENSDGLFIQPLVGKKKVGDYTPKAILSGYKALIKDYLPSNRIVLGVLSTVMRYAGPREAIFHAIIRRNYGCTHFIVGRDHAGVGSWYGLYDAHELTRKFDGDLGIEIMRLKGPYYCVKCKEISTENSCPHSQCGDIHSISGTDMRRILRSGVSPGEHLMRQEVINALKDIDCFI
jgi:sulfate adenylyltransferase